MADAWNALSSVYTNEKRLLAVLSNIAPTISHLPECELILENEYQEVELKIHLDKILIHLKKQLHNDFIKLNTKVKETQVTRVAYTPQEKFNLLAAQNPHLQEFAEEFMLQLS